VVLIILIEAALITPPVGLHLDVVQGLRGRGSLPFVIAMLALIALLMAAAEIALWLPRYFMLWRCDGEPCQQQARRQRSLALNFAPKPGQLQRRQATRWCLQGRPQPAGRQGGQQVALLRHACGGSAGRGR
jgi:hypothetical protein